MSPERKQLSWISKSPSRRMSVLATRMPQLSLVSLDPSLIVLSMLVVGMREVGSGMYRRPVGTGRSAGPRWSIRIRDLRRRSGTTVV